MRYWNSYWHRRGNMGQLADFLPCIRVCRKWHDLGIALAWRVLIFDREKIERLITSALNNFLDY
jgi:hypothetical protein